jgi:hypothetical protein
LFKLIATHTPPIFRIRRKLQGSGIGLSAALLSETAFPEILLLAPGPAITSDRTAGALCYLIESTEPAQQLPSDCRQSAARTALPNKTTPSKDLKDSAS